MLSTLASSPWLASFVPILWFFLCAAVYSIPLHFRSLKWPVLLPLLYCCYRGFRASSLWPWPGFDSLWGLLMCIWTLYLLSMLFLEDHQSLIIHGHGPLAEQTWWGKLWATWNNGRLLGTSKEEPSAAIPTSGLPKYRTDFVFRRSAKLIFYICFNWLILPRILPVLFAPLSLKDFDSVRQTFFRRLFSDHAEPVTLREICLRAVFAVLWALPTYVMVDGAHIALSLVFVVVLRVNSPEEWPPIYGDIREAYTLTRFWSKFWHKIIVISYSNISKAVCRAIGIYSSSLLYKLAVAGIVFFLSGLTHAATSWQLGDAECWYLDIFWFLLNFALCTAETCLRTMVISIFGQSKASEGRKLGPRPLTKGTGYLAVFFFFFWSVPKWQYPKTYYMILNFMRPV